MIVEINNFSTVDGTYHILWDNALYINEPYVNFVPVGTGIERTSVTEAERGYPQDQEFTASCSSDGTFSFVHFKASLTTPFAYNSGADANSAFCGHTPFCDLIINSLVVTNPTTEFNIDGSITVTATSTYTGIMYSLDNINFQSSNVFADLSPGSYTVFTIDSNGCTSTQSANIFSFQSPPTGNEKYHVRFTTEKDGKNITLKIFDTQNSFKSPILLTADADNPIEKIYRNDEEYKYQPIIGCSVNVNLIADGKFSTDEFNYADEQKWRAEIYIDDVLDFQGFIMPDEAQDIYDDTPYPYQLVITDGLASLKGVDFIDLNGSKIYGLYPMIRIFQYCFARLNYDIGTTKLISSLTVSFASGIVDQWNKLLIWGDCFYDTEGTPDDCYTVLEKIMISFGMRLFQHHGSFIIQSVYDIPFDTSAYSIYFNQSFTQANLDGTLTAPIRKISVNSVDHPVNPTQTIRFDKAISILNGNVSFKSIALLNKDPSFENGNIDGQLPYGWKYAPGASLLKTYMKYDPAGAYNGDWALQIGTSTVKTTDTNGFGANFIDQTNGGYLVDQLNKKVNVSFVFSPYVSGGDASFFVIPVFSLLLGGNSGQVWWFNTGDNNSDGYMNWDSGPEKPLPNSIKYERDFLSSPIVPFNGTIKSGPDRRYYQMSFSTNEMPEMGMLALRFCGTVTKESDGYITNYENSHGQPILTGITVYIDQLQITLSDANDDYSLQISETHRFSNKQKYSKSQTKELSADFYTYLNNKYISGNVLYGTDYKTSQIDKNTWKYALGGFTLDRLPKIIFEGIGRNYQRPMVIFDGDIRSDDLSYFDVLQINKYGEKKFMTLSLTKNYKASINTIVSVEIEPADYNKTYTYIPKYKTNARTV